jgi:hypothetical protein
MVTNDQCRGIPVVNIPILVASQIMETRTQNGATSQLNAHVK